MSSRIKNLFNSSSLKSSSHDSLSHKSPFSRSPVASIVRIVTFLSMKNTITQTALFSVFIPKITLTVPHVSFVLAWYALVYTSAVLLYRVYDYLVPNYSCFLTGRLNTSSDCAIFIRSSIILFRTGSAAFVRIFTSTSIKRKSNMSVQHIRKRYCCA